MTKISMGRNPNRTGSGVVRPPNTGIAHIANQKIDNLVAAQNRKHQEALKTDGTDCWLFTKQRAGLPCTCQTRSVTDNTLTIHGSQAEGSSNLGPMQAGDHDTSPSVRTFRIRDYNGTFGNSAISPIPPAGNTLRDIHDRRMQQHTDFQQSELIPVEQENAIEDIISMADEFTDPADAALQRQPLMQRLYGGEKTRCGICFGSGFVQGYQLHGGMRIVLDTTLTYPMQLVDCEISTSTTPAAFIIERSGTKYVQWTVQLPTYFEKVLAIHVRNNADPAVAFHLEGKVGLGPWTTLTPAFLNALRGTPTTLLVRVRPVTSSAPGTQQFTFTHVELFYQLTSTLKANLPTFIKSVDFEQFDVLQTLSGVEFPASIPMLDREAVLVEDKYNQAWSVTEVEQKQTARMATFNNVVSMRLIQQYETKFLLNLVQGKPVELTYGGTLEKIQGQGMIP